MIPGVDFKLFYASELNIAEICLQESISSYVLVKKTCKTTNSVFLYMWLRVFSANDT